MKFLFFKNLKIVRFLDFAKSARLRIVKRYFDDFLRQRASSVLIEGQKVYVPKFLEKSYQDFHEKYTIELFKKILKKGDVVFDIGANIGYYSFLATKLIGENGRIYAFEPDPRNYRFLIKNIKFNKRKNIKFFPIAVGNKIGESLMNLDIDSTESSIIKLRTRENAVLKSIFVPIMTIDAFVREHKVKKIDILKIDVEGSESLVIQGMQNTLRRSNSVVMFIEFCPRFLQDAGKAPIDFLAQLRYSGLRVLGIDEDMKRLFKKPENYIDKDGKILGKNKINLLAVKGKLKL